MRRFPPIVLALALFLCLPALHIASGAFVQSHSASGTINTAVTSPTPTPPPTPTPSPSPTPNPDSDLDGDGITHVVETACGSDPASGSSIPERVDGPFAGVDDDGNDGADEPLPPGAEAYDCDGDGYTGATENHVSSYRGQTDGDQKTCQDYDLTHPNTNGSIKPSLAWPSDFNKSTSPKDSFNRINILDLTSFIVPIRYFGTDVGTNPGDVRWDLVPGPGTFGTDINLQDLTAMIAGASGSPPMLGEARALNGPVCPWGP